VADTAPEQATLSDIDFSAYVRPDLFSSVEKILGVRESLFYCVRVAAFSWLVMLGITGWWLHEQGWTILVSTVFAVGIVGFLTSVLLGVILTVRRLLDEIVHLLDISLEIVGRVMLDIADVQDRGLALTAATVLEGVSNEIIVPTIESVINAKLGFLGKPILWVYRGTFVRVTKQAARILVKYGETIDNRFAEEGDKSFAFGDTVEVGAEWSHQFISVAREFASGSARRVKLVLFLPFWALFGLLLVLLIAIVALAGSLG
jgi:hypothetical protein